MTILDQTAEDSSASESLLELCRTAWRGRVVATLDDDARICRLECGLNDLVQVCHKLSRDLGFAFATLIVEEEPSAGWSLTYIFYRDVASPWVYVELQLDPGATTVPSISGLSHGPSVDWHEREAEDLFGLRFAGHPRLGEFILHEDWPEGVNPMRRDFDARQFLLETVGEDVIHTIPRFFYKYRGVEKIAEGQQADRALLLAERFSGTSAFAHGMGFCQAVEAVCGTTVPPRARALRTILAELERLRHHAAAITGICNSTALAVATSQAALIEEDLLRLTCAATGHRYLFGVVAPGGLARDLSDETCTELATAVESIAKKLRDLHQMLRYSSSFLDRLEEVGIISNETAVSYGLVGPIARASGLSRDIRKLFPYAGYRAVEFEVPVEQEGDGYARLRILFHEAEQSARTIRRTVPGLPAGPVGSRAEWRAGAALGTVEAPLGAAFHWVRLREDGTVARYRITPPSFANWHGFHLAAENFAFQDFPIILASFGLSNAECDR